LLEGKHRHTGSARIDYAATDKFIEPNIPYNQQKALGRTNRLLFFGSTLAASKYIILRENKPRQQSDLISSLTNTGEIHRQHVDLIGTVTNTGEIHRQHVDLISTVTNTGEIHRQQGDLISLVTNTREIHRQQVDHTSLVTNIGEI
jgi:hypothetical protein